MDVVTESVIVTLLFPGRCSQYVLATAAGEGSGLGEAGHDVNRDVDDECGDLERESDGEDDHDIDMSEPALNSKRGVGAIPAMSSGLCSMCGACLALERVYKAVRTRVELSWTLSSV